MLKCKGKYCFVFCVCLVAVMILGLDTVSGLIAISAHYSQNRPLNMEEGGEKIVVFTLSNLFETKEKKVKVSLTKGEEIAEIINVPNEIVISPGIDKDVQVRVTIPSNNALDEYEVSLYVEQEPGEEEQGNLQFVSNIQKTIPIIVGDVPQVSPEAKEPGFLDTLDRKKDSKTIAEVEIEKEEIGGEGIWKLIIWGFVLSIIVVIVMIVVISFRAGRRRDVVERNASVYRY